MDGFSQTYSRDPHVVCGARRIAQKVSGSELFACLRLSLLRRALIAIPLNLIELHVAIVVGDVRGEGVRAVVFGHEIEEVALGRRGGGAQRSQPGIGDWSRRQAVNA